MTEQQKISRSQAWLESLRPKTLPLAFAAIIVGTALAWWQGYFDPLVALLALITAGLLQILSNLANDYGDAVKGSDKPDRIGPLRGMQKGVITQQQMKRALIVTVVLICLSGLALVAVACHTLADFVGFLVLGACRLSRRSPTPWVIALTDISVWAIFPCWYSLAGLA
ncbi:1,4-dihydroxy-2-naphthoate octaprenyltransferase [Citrobacter braakii]|nr:1,4-dihydroxy-2-naphthoate octaprenyltransferase [Citrobacter braakii]